MDEGERGLGGWLKESSWGEVAAITNAHRGMVEQVPEYGVECEVAVGDDTDWIPRGAGGLGDRVRRCVLNTVGEGKGKMWGSNGADGGWDG